MSHAAVTYDARSLRIDGKRDFLISGAIHYPRSTPRMWPGLFRHSKACGLNTIETYVFWETHEHDKGRYDFSGRRDLRTFIRLAEAAGLYVVLKCGPYVCAEWNFGGFPPWLIHEPGLRMRTWNEPFMRRVKEWLQVLFAEVGDLQYPDGPIILVQPENEYRHAMATGNYGKAGLRYLQWTGDVFRELGIQVPLIMCYGGSRNVIETLNGFAVHDRIPALRRQRPGQPILWTELYPGYYDIWGHHHRKRHVREMAAQILRFVAAGGAGFNYYMWHGGTNFERTAMYLQTTSYDFDAPLDEFGRVTAKARHLARLHRALARVKDALLSRQPCAHRAADGVTVTRLGPITIVDNPTTRPAIVALGRGTTARLKPGAAQLYDDEALLFDSHQSPPKTVLRSPPARTIQLKQWTVRHEPLPVARSRHGLRGIPLSRPESMLPYSRDHSDYGWYSTTIQVNREGLYDLELPAAADLVYVFLDGLCRLRLPEGIPAEYRDRQAFRLNGRIPIAPGSHRLDLLAVSLGLIKIDQQIGANMADEKKGVWRLPRLNGQRVRGSWILHWGLAGERGRWMDPDVLGSLDWTVLAGNLRPLSWHHACFNLAAETARKTASWRLTGAGTGKGFVWINGHGLGRYWLIPPAPKESPGGFAPYVELDSTAGPQHDFLHVPADWLVAGVNHLVVFEEQGSFPAWTLTPMGK